MKKFIISPLFILALCLLTSCSTSSPNTSTATAQLTSLPTVTPTPSPTPRIIDGYMRTDEDGVWFDKWVEKDGQLTGIWSILYHDKEDKVHRLSGPLTGTLVEDKITLLKVINGQEVSATGILSGDTMTLVAADENGILRTVIYDAVSMAEYQQAVDNFQAKYPDPTPTPTKK